MWICLYLLRSYFERLLFAKNQLLDNLISKIFNVKSSKSQLKIKKIAAGQNVRIQGLESRFPRSWKLIKDQLFFFKCNSHFSCWSLNLSTSLSTNWETFVAGRRQESAQSHWNNYLRSLSFSLFIMLLKCTIQIVIGWVYRVEGSIIPILFYRVNLGLGILD